jgi:two-component system response regulator AtoC
MSMNLLKPTDGTTVRTNLDRIGPLQRQREQSTVSQGSIEGRVEELTELDEHTRRASDQEQPEGAPSAGMKPVSILAVDDSEDFLDMLKRMLEQEGYSVATAPDGVEAIHLLQDRPFDLILLDLNMPRIDGFGVLKFVKGQFLDCEVIMLTAIDQTRAIVESMKLGAYYYVTKPSSAGELLPLIERALERKKLRRQNHAFKVDLARRANSFRIVSQNRAFLEMLDVALRAAPTDSSVLIQGASGTGKELVANFLHANSSRRDQPYMALNCASIPETLIESELFGHEKGAFTDAVTTKQGLVEIANGGTLFLDEVAEIALTVQPKLLRFLQTGEYRRVGGTKNFRSDVRIVSATNRDLREEAEQCRFREDLLYRLNVITLSLPPLRERKDDIPLLVEYFLTKRAVTKGLKRLEPRALEVLMRYDWPGNIRELENVIERAAGLSRGDVIFFDDLALPLASKPVHNSHPDSSSEGLWAGSAVSLAEIQKAHVLGVLRSVNWNKDMASKILGMSVKTLYSKMQAYNFREPKKSSSSLS